MSDFVNTVDSIGDEALAGSIIDKSITEILDNYATRIGYSAFYKCFALTTANFPAVTKVDNYAFYNCFALATVDFPAATSIGNYTFYDCSALTTVGFPVATSIGSNAFYGCSNLTTVDLPTVASISANAFYNCSKLTSLILRSGVMAKLVNASAFTRTPIASGTGYIYVPATLVDSYKAANNWSTFAAQFRSLEDYTVDGTTTGALDASKI